VRAAGSGTGCNAATAGAGSEGVVPGKVGAVGAALGSAGVAGAAPGKFNGVGATLGNAGVAGAGVAGTARVGCGGVTGSAPGVGWTVPQTTPEPDLCGVILVSISPLSTALPCSRSVVVQSPPSFPRLTTKAAQARKKKIPRLVHFKTDFREG